MHASKKLIPMILTTLTAVLLANCNEPTFQALPDSPKYHTASLMAKSLSFGATINVPMTIRATEILASNSGSSLSLGGVGAPSNGGQLTENGSDFTFVSNVLGESQISYWISDSSGARASSTITIHVLQPEKMTGAFYGTNNAGNIYVFDSTGAFEAAVNTTYNGSRIGFNDLAIDDSGALFGKTYSGSTNAIYKVDGSTGIATRVSSNLIPAVRYMLAGLTFLPDGRIVTAVPTTANGFNDPMALVAVDLNTNVVSTIVPSQLGYHMNDGGDVKYLPDGYLYWTVENSPGSLCAGSGNQDIIRIDPNSGAVKEVGCLTQQGVYGLGFAFGDIYGFSGSGNLVKIDLDNAEVTLISATGERFVGGASNPALW